MKLSVTARVFFIDCKHPAVLFCFNCHIQLNWHELNESAGLRCGTVSELTMAPEKPEAPSSPSGPGSPCKTRGQRSKTQTKHTNRSKHEISFREIKHSVQSNISISL